LLTVCFLSSCATYSDTFFAMGTFMSLTVYDTNEQTAKTAVAEIVDYVDELEKLFSTRLPGSALKRFRFSEQDFQDFENLPAEFEEVLALSLEWMDKTDGAFNVQLQNLTSLWAFDSDEPRVPSDEEIAAALSETAQLDFGAVAKGYAARKAALILESHGIKSAIINLGGDVYIMGDSRSVGIIDPLEPSRICGVLNVSNKAVATSANYERYFEVQGERYHHILDSKTGKPAQSGIISATVITDDPAVADILATAFYVMGEQKAAEFKENFNLTYVDYILVDETGRQFLSEGFSVEYEPK